MKKTLKKISAASLVAFLFITLVACGGGNNTAATSESEATIESTVETVEESSEEVEEHEPTVDELRSTFNGPGELAGSPFEIAMENRGMGNITQSISTKDIISVTAEGNTSLGGIRTVVITVVDEQMEIRYSYLLDDVATIGAVVEAHTENLGKVSVSPGSFDAIDQKKDEIARFIDYWNYDNSKQANPLDFAHTENETGPWFRTVEFPGVDRNGPGNDIVNAYLMLQRSFHEKGEYGAIMFLDDDVATVTTNYGVLTFDKHNRIVKNTDGQVIATGAPLERVGRLEFNTIPFDDAAEVQKVIDAMFDLHPQTKALF